MTEPSPEPTRGPTPEQTTPAAEGRRSLRRAAGLGVPLAALAAVAAAKSWRGGGSGGGDATMVALDQGQRYPLASAAALVLLAGWGVLLVTRGRVRQGFAVVTLLAALALVVTVVAGYLTLPDQPVTSYDELVGRRAGDTGWTGWFWTAAVTAVLSLLPAWAAVRGVRSWPEMGRRYDAPGQAVPEPVDHEPRTERELWEQLDEGRDPTDR